MFDPPVTTIAIVRSFPKDKIYQLELPNGKLVVGHIARAMIDLHEQVQEGSRVKVEMTPYDFEKARIVEVLAD